MLNFWKFISAAAILAVSSALLAPLPAMAEHEQQPPGQPSPSAPDPSEWQDGFYYILDFDLGDSVNPMTDQDFGVDLDWSTGLGIGVGFRLAEFLRLEGEIHSNYYRVGSLDLGSAPPFLPEDYAGGMWAQGAMANLIFDLPAAGAMRPYLGAGYGFSRVSAEYNEAFCLLFCFSSKNQVVDDWDFAEAWQAMAGVSFSNPSADSEFFVGYRYFKTDDLDFKTVDGTAFTQEGLENHSITFGMRFFM